MTKLLIVDDKPTIFEFASGDVISNSIFELESSPDDENIGLVRDPETFKNLIDYIYNSAPSELNCLLDVYFTDDVQDSPYDYLNRLNHELVELSDHGLAVLQAIIESPRIQRGVIIINSAGDNYKRHTKILNSLKDRPDFRSKRIFVRCLNRLKSQSTSPDNLLSCIEELEKDYLWNLGVPVENVALKNFFEFFGSHNYVTPHPTWSHEWMRLLGPSEADALAKQFGSFIEVDGLSMGHLDGLLQVPTEAKGVFARSAKVRQDIIHAFLKKCGVEATFEGHPNIGFPRKPGIGYLIALAELVAYMEREGCPPKSVHFRTSDFGAATTLTIKFYDCPGQRGSEMHAEFGYLMRFFEKMRKGRYEGLLGRFRELSLGISSTLSQSNSRSSSDEGQRLGQADVLLSLYPVLQWFTVDGSTSLIVNVEEPCSACQLDRLHSLVDLHFSSDGVSMSWPSTEI